MPYIEKGKNIVIEEQLFKLFSFFDAWNRFMASDWKRCSNMPPTKCGDDVCVILLLLQRLPQPKIANKNKTKQKFLASVNR